MATSISSEQKSFEAGVSIPEDVVLKLDGSTVVAKGPLGECRKDFSAIPVQIDLKDKKLTLRSTTRRKKDYSILNTARSHIINMIHGVTKGFEYRLKVVYAHFPISVRVKGREVRVENFYGERAPRVAKIVGDCKVSVEGDDVIVRGVSIEDVGQTAANIEQATTIKRKDQRVFLDGVYIYEKRRS